MYGSRANVMSFRNRRRPLRPNILHSRSKRRRPYRLAAIMLLRFLLTPAAAAQTQGPVRITLDEAIQMALQHDHNLLAARTTIQQSQAEETTANMPPNPSLLPPSEYLPTGSPPAPTPPPSLHQPTTPT